MQGGISFLSTQYGLAGDVRSIPNSPNLQNLITSSQNVKEYEIVLANGTIANLSYERHPDLVVAMRGSGDQFGSCFASTAVSSV
jgi:hypothetical protein